MAFRLRFRRSEPLLGGLFRVNINRRSVSLTGRLGPFSRTWSSNGTRTTNVNLPGRGASLRDVSTRASRQREADALRARRDAALARREARREARRRRRS